MLTTEFAQVVLGLIAQSAADVRMDAKSALHGVIIGALLSESLKIRSKLLAAVLELNPILHDELSTVTHVMIKEWDEREAEYYANTASN